MKDALILTTLDVAGRQNNREHHAIAALAERAGTLTVVYRMRGRAGQGPGALIANEVREHVEDGVRYIGVSPPLNPPEGRARALAGGNLDRPALPRRALGTALDTAGILRDLFSMRSLEQAARYALGDKTSVLCEAFGPWAVLAAAGLRRSNRIGRLVYIDRDYEPGFMAAAPRRHWAEHAERRAARTADLTLSIGTRLAGRFAGVPGAQVMLSPTGVDTARFAPRIRKSPEPHLIYVGQVAPWSGLSEVLAALPDIVPHHPRLKLTILGPSEPGFERWFRQQIADSGQSSRVDWPGERSRDEVAAALNRAGIGLATFRPTPLRAYAAPLKVLEYMASGLPVLSTAGTEAGDLVDRTGTGAATSCDPQAIARAAIALLNNATTYAEMSGAGTAAARLHDWSLVMSWEWQMITEPDLASLQMRRAAVPEGMHP